ncbi:hypothetical protein GQS52_00160 [Streptomyces sp. SCUT-3]|uniref:tetratricopeptide repeat protein n=1 Tax=Streptomyces sp. SCUT-3 TaxID=2684469 RepID=UPI0015FCD761|nr:tetratricopeptide repeat protein [Streptomyces sp. SCUT-3]QMV20485.1 hypothetical protein GQS52_00160 [Streptomyces sp. SCUT-3]
MEPPLRRIRPGHRVRRDAAGRDEPDRLHRRPHRPRGARHRRSRTDVVGRRGPRHPERALADHAAHYPPADPARPTELEPLTPDRLAEDFVALTLPGHFADYPARDWAPSVLRALLPHTPGAPTAPWTPRALTLVAAAADRWPHVRTGYLDPLLREAPWLAVAAGGGALGTIAALADLDVEVLDAVAAHLPNRDDADLDPAAAVLAVRLADHLLAATDDPAKRAAVHRNLGWSLAGAGRYAESLAAAERAVAGYEALARADPDRYEHDLALALNNLSLRYDYERRTDEAVAAMERAVEIGRRRLTEPVGRHAADLALHLSNYGNLLKHAGRWLESLQAGSEALVRYHRLATADPAAHQGALAVALLNHGSDLSAALRTEAAIDATRQAVAMLRRLAADRPAAHEGTLAIGLENLASMLTEQGQSAEQVLTWHLRSGGAPTPELLPPQGWREEALAAIEQAVEIDRRRARANPAALEAGLAGALQTSAAVRRACGMETAALTDEREAAALTGRLGAAAEPHRAEHRETYGPQATEVLYDVELALYRCLAAADLATHGPQFALLLDLHRPTAADSERPGSLHDPTALREAAEVNARLAALDPVAYEPDYAYALIRLADALWWEGEHTESVPATERAAEVTARLAAVDPRSTGRSSPWSGGTWSAALPPRAAAARPAPSAVCTAAPPHDPSRRVLPVAFGQRAVPCRCIQVHGVTAGVFRAATGRSAMSPPAPAAGRSARRLRPGAFAGASPYPAEQRKGQDPARGQAAQRFHRLRDPDREGRGEQHGESCDADDRADGVPQHREERAGLAEHGAAEQHPDGHGRSVRAQQPGGDQHRCGGQHDQWRREVGPQRDWYGKQAPGDGEHEHRYECVFQGHGLVGPGRPRRAPHVVAVQPGRLQQV